MNTLNTKTNQLFNTVNEHFAGELTNKRIAVWGVTDKSGRLDSATCQLIQQLVDSGVEVAIHSDSGNRQLQTRFGNNVDLPENKWDTVRHADALIVASHDAQYCCIDAGRLTWSVAERTLFDVHGSVNRDSLQYSSFAHYAFDESDHDQNETPVTLPFEIRKSNNERPFFANATLALVG